ncbi:hypothetical protein ACFP6A_06180 [Quadrisphaera sp. GCM10027208]|uniref:hypothetical protein n=1 Tax=Quadrisphaera sp. GCM10027208 TaxID=3273423 RepID=UPI00361D9A6F
MNSPPGRPQDHLRGPADMPPHPDALEARLATVLAAPPSAMQPRTDRAAIVDALAQLRPLPSATPAVSGS